MALRSCCGLTCEGEVGRVGRVGSAGSAGRDAWEDTPLAVELGLPPAARVLLGHGEHISSGKGEFCRPGGGVRMESLDRDWRGKRSGGSGMD